MPGIQLFPDQASTAASRTDALFLTMLALVALIATTISVLIIYFAIRYRRRAPNEIPEQIEGSNKLEITWTVVPLGLAMVFFFWAAGIYLDNARPPDDAMEIYVVGRMWMWKFVHPTGQEEINELHVPMGRNIRLTATSEDVIHSFFVPAFRVKSDVLPERYTTLWFNATKPGQYHLFCTQYCGTDHAMMTGWVYVMEPAAFQQWAGIGTSGPAALGAQLFQQLGCAGCHRADNTGAGPALVGLYGKPVRIQGANPVLADENYLRESILNPNAKVVEGYQPIMPTFQGQVNDEQLMQLIAYIKALSAPASSIRSPIP